MLFGWREMFVYLLCPGCGAMRIVSPPVDLARHYPNEYFDGYRGRAAPIPEEAPVQRVWVRDLAATVSAERFLFRRSRVAARILHKLAPTIPPEVRRWKTFVHLAGLRSFNDPILDVGGGRRSPQLMDLRLAGFRRLLGIDPYLDADRKVHDVLLLRRRIDEVQGSFQVITFNHSFEHVPDPRATLAAAAARLRRNGAVLIRTPIMGSWFWEHFRTNWWELDPPRHLFIHSERSLDILARDVGLVRTATVWESTYLEMIASDQIERGIPWRSEDSWHNGPPAGYSDAAIAAYKSIVADLNREGRAGRAALWFRREGTREQ